MTQEETKRIDELKTARFILSMKDYWNNRDFERDRELLNEIRTIKAKYETKR